jgi:hypothetical protein
MNDLPIRRPLPGNNGPDASLLAIAEELSAHGLTVRKTWHAQEVIELSVTDPKHTVNGRVVVGYEGWLTWEYDCLIETPAGAQKASNLVISLLAHGTPQSDGLGMGQ